MIDEWRPKNRRDCEDCGEPITLMQLLVDGKCFACRRKPRQSVDYILRYGPHENPWWCKDD